MKSKLIIVTLLIAFVFSFHLVGNTSAQTASPSSERVRRNAQAQNGEAREQEMQNREAKRVQLSQDKSERFLALLDRVLPKLEAVIARLENLSSRIAARLVKIQEVNPEVDTTEIETALGKADDLISQASLLLATFSETLDDKLAELETSDDPGLILTDLMADLKEIRGMLGEANTVLVQVIGQVKGLSLER